MSRYFQKLFGVYSKKISYIPGKYQVFALPCVPPPRLCLFALPGVPPPRLCLLTKRETYNEIIPLRMHSFHFSCLVKRHKQGEKHLSSCNPLCETLPITHKMGVNLVIQIFRYPKSSAPGRQLLNVCSPVDRTRSPCRIAAKHRWNEWLILTGSLALFQQFGIVTFLFACPKRKVTKRKRAVFPAKPTTCGDCAAF